MKTEKPMKSISDYKGKSKICNFLIRVVLLIIGIVIVLIIIYFQLLLSTIRFITMMEHLPVPHSLAIQPPPTTDKFIEELKQIASFLLDQPEKNRRVIVFTYNAYINVNIDSPFYYDRVFKLFLLQRIIFNVPEEYPIANVYSYLVWSKSSEANMGSTYNMLWPLAIQDGRLIIKTMPGMFYSSYDAYGEYTYFVTRFPFRSKDELK